MAVANSRGHALVGRGRERAALARALEAVTAGTAGSCSSRVRRASARRVWWRMPYGSRRGVRAWRCARAAGAAVRADRGGAAGTPPASMRAALDDCGPSGRYLGVFLPELGAPPRAASRDGVRGGALRLPRDRCAARRPGSSFSTTCTGRTRRRSSCCRRSRPPSSTSRCCWSGRTAATRSRAVILCARMRAELRRAHQFDGAGARSVGARSRPRPYGARPARRRPRSRGRCTTARRGFRSSSRSCARRLPGRTDDDAGPGSNSPTATSCPFRTACGTRSWHGGDPSAEARSVLEAASVAGLRFDLALVAELAGDAAIDEPVASGIVAEDEPGVGDVPPQPHARGLLLRRSVGPTPPPASPARRAAARSEARGPQLVAEHWAAAGEPERARPALPSRGAARSRPRTPIATRSEWCRRALDIWPSSDEKERLALLERLGQCAELSGDLSAAVLAWEEVADARRAEGDLDPWPKLERRLALVYELQGAVERALEAHERAAETFSDLRQDADAAAELLAAASHLDAIGSSTPALELVEQAAIHANAAQRRDLIARALGPRGERPRQARRPRRRCPTGPRRAVARPRRRSHGVCDRGLPAPRGRAGERRQPPCRRAGLRAGV